ncbi:MAG: N-formylglutamate deformylase [Gemmatimonadota bacterium]|nr:N-formylglutamate deformylase [Gemmatimonadota bacterium]
MSSPVVTLRPGQTPLLVSLPHIGQHIPPELADAFLPHALHVEDTDWHLDQVYDFVPGLGASLIVPHHSRYVIDLNRPSDNRPMYPGVNNTELCPTRSFTGAALYRDGLAPDAAEVARRTTRYWQPYHDALRWELERLKREHGYAILLDGHSIKSELPWLFPGRLPDLNLGTADGTSCAPALRDVLAAVLAAQTCHTHVVDGRFKGGYITRHYGQPGEGIHAVQLEKCWSCYMQESPPYAWDAPRAAPLRPVLREFVETALAWRPA